MDEIISYKMCAVKVRNAKLRNYLKHFEGIEVEVETLRLMIILQMTTPYHYR